MFIGIGLAVPIDVAGGAAGLPPVLSPDRTRRSTRGSADGPAIDPPRWSGCCTRSRRSSSARTTCSSGWSIALLCRGHILVEGVPGLAKTMAIKTVADTIGGEFKRIQFTPDLVPADLVGTRIYNQKTGEFGTSLGPVFTNLLLADEINRAPAKVQSALLEVMQERQVTIGRETHKVPDPFLVLATQNPIETEGTYALPEAQVDRFMMKVLVDYPSETEEFVIVERMTGDVPTAQPVVTTDGLLAMQRAADKVFVDPALMAYAVRLAAATRDPGGARAGRPRALHHVRREPAGVDQPRCSRPARWRSSAAATTRCPRTCSTWRSTSSATGSCCRSRRCPTTSPATGSCATIIDRVPVPVVPLRDR